MRAACFKYFRKKNSSTLQLAKQSHFCIQPIIILENLFTEARFTGKKPALLINEL